MNRESRRANLPKCRVDFISSGSRTLICIRNSESNERLFLQPSLDERCPGPQRLCLLGGLRLIMDRLEADDALVHPL